MKAEIDSHGVVTLTAESSVEAYALRQWVVESLVMQDDVKRAEKCHWRGSRLLVSTNMAKED